jgi:hypothetical protein
MTDKLEEEILQEVVEDQTDDVVPTCTQEGDSVKLTSDSLALLSSMPPSIMRDLQTRLDKKALPLDESNPASMVIIQKVYDNYIKKRERARLASAKTRAAKKSGLEVVLQTAPASHPANLDKPDVLKRHDVPDDFPDDVPDEVPEQVHVELTDVAPDEVGTTFEVPEELTNYEPTYELHQEPHAGEASALAPGQPGAWDNKASEPANVRITPPPKPPTKKQIRKNSLTGIVKLA